MVLPLRVPLQLFAVKINFAQVSFAVSHRLIVEMRGCRVAALASGRYRPRMNFGAKFDHRHETVSTGSIPLFRPRIRSRSERCQRAPERRGESHGNARPGVAERLDNVPRQALEAIDVTPRRFPRAEIRSQFVGSFGKRL